MSFYYTQKSILVAIFKFWVSLKTKKLYQFFRNYKKNRKGAVSRKQYRETNNMNLFEV